MSDVYLPQIYTDCRSKRKLSLVRSLASFKRPVCLFQLYCVFHWTQLGIYTINHMMSEGRSYWICITETGRRLKRSETTHPQSPPVLFLNLLTSHWLSSSISRWRLLVLWEKLFHVGRLRKWDNSLCVILMSHSFTSSPVLVVPACVYLCSGTPAGLQKAICRCRGSTWLRKLK